MIIDTHSHPLITKEADINWDLIRLNFETAKEHGIDVLCITEHLDAVNYRILIEKLFIENTLSGTFLADGVLKLSNSLIISSGCEVSLKNGSDIGVHASPEILLTLNNIKGFYDIESIYNTLNYLTDNYVIVAHHLYNPGKWINNFESVVEKFDAIEVPGKTPENSKDYISLAKKFNKPVVSGSDSHTWVQIGIGTTELPLESSGFSIPKFKSALNNSTTLNNINFNIIQNARRFVNMSKLYRKSLMC